MIATRFFCAQSTTEQPSKGLTSSGWDNRHGYRLEDANEAASDDWKQGEVSHV